MSTSAEYFAILFQKRKNTFATAAEIHVPLTTVGTEKQPAHR